MLVLLNGCLKSGFELMFSHTLEPFDSLFAEMIASWNACSHSIFGIRNSKRLMLNLVIFAFLFCTPPLWVRQQKIDEFSSQ